MTSTSKPLASAGAREERAARERGAFPHAHQPVARDRLSAGRTRAEVPDAHAERLVAVQQVDLDVRTRSVAPGIRQRLLDDPVRGQVDAQREPPDIPAPRDADIGSRRPRLVDQIVEVAEPGLGRPVGLAAGVFAKHAEQPAGLGERLARRRGDRFEPAAGVARELGRGQPRSLALDRDHRQVVRDDVVQLPGDARTLFHHRSRANALRHRLLRRIELRNREPPLPDRLADHERREEQQQRDGGREARPAPSNGVAVFRTNGMSSGAA